MSLNKPLEEWDMTFAAHSFQIPWSKTFQALGRLLDTPEKWHRFEWDSFEPYRRVVDYLATLLLGIEVPYYFQREPNLRVHPTGGTVVPWHTDAEFGHLEAEWNCWIPVTPITDTSQQVWLTTEEGIRYPPYVALGYALCFRGAVVEHGNAENLASERRSFDFRLLATVDYRDRDLRTVEYGVPLRHPEYWRRDVERRERRIVPGAPRGDRRRADTDPPGLHRSDAPGA